MPVKLHNNISQEHTIMQHFSARRFIHHKTTQKCVIIYYIYIYYDFKKFVIGVLLKCFSKKIVIQKNKQLE